MVVGLGSAAAVVALLLAMVALLIERDPAAVASAVNPTVGGVVSSPTPAPTEVSVAPPPTVASVPTSDAAPALTATAAAVGTTVPAPVATRGPSPRPSPAPIPTPRPTATPAPTATPTLPPPTPTPLPTVAPEGFVRSEFVPELIVAAAVIQNDLPRLLAEHQNAVIGQPFRPGRALGVSYRLLNVAEGQRVRRVWLHEGRIAAEASVEWRPDLPEIWRASLAPHLVRGGNWDVRLEVDGNLVAAQPFDVDAEALVVDALQFATELLADGRAARPAHVFPPGAEVVYATFEVFNAPRDLAIEVRWVHDGAVVEEVDVPWPGLSGPGSWQPVALPRGAAGGPPLEPGDWRFVLSVDGEELLNDVFKIEAP